MLLLVYQGHISTAIMYYNIRIILNSIMYSSTLFYVNIVIALLISLCYWELSLNTFYWHWHLVFCIIEGLTSSPLLLTLPELLHFSFLNGLSYMMDIYRCQKLTLEHMENICKTCLSLQRLNLKTICCVNINMQYKKSDEITRSFYWWAKALKQPVLMHLKKCPIHPFVHHNFVWIETQCL